MKWNENGDITMSNDGKMEWQNTYYVCPVCEQPLVPTLHGLFCERDGVEYDIKNGIPDFFVEDFTESTSPLLKSVGEFDALAKVYEGTSWYGTFDIILAELGLPSIEEGAKTIAEMVDAKGGVGLDVACGTGFFTRHLAGKMRVVYGIDISMGMLEKATEYAQERGIENVHFARSKAERLPFSDGVFDGVICSGALHLFPDTVEALKEMARVLKMGARVAVMTFVKQDLSTFKMMFERVGASSHFSEEESEALHLFEVEELEGCLSQTGFTGFAYDIYGPFILFHAEKE